MHTLTHLNQQGAAHMVDIAVCEDQKSEAVPGGLVMLAMRRPLEVRRWRCLSLSCEGKASLLWEWTDSQERHVQG